MRAASALLLFLTLCSGEAGASSFLVLPAYDGKSSPSIVTLEPPAQADVTTLGAAEQAPDVTIGEVDKPPQEAAGGSIVMLSPSIVAMGEPAVAQEKVAAIGEERAKPRPEPLPMVIRGGIVGDAFSTAATGEPVPLTTEPKEAGQQAKEAPPPQKGAPPPDDQAIEAGPTEPAVPEPDIKME